MWQYSYTKLTFQCGCAPVGAFPWFTGLRLKENGAAGVAKVISLPLFEPE
jgi:hypothetical protein